MQKIFMFNSIFSCFTVWIVCVVQSFHNVTLRSHAHLGWQFCQRRWGCGWSDSSSGGYETAICIPWWLYAGLLQWRARCLGFVGSVFSDDDLATPGWGPTPTAHSWSWWGDCLRMPHSQYPWWRNRKVDFDKLEKRVFSSDWHEMQIIQEKGLFSCHFLIDFFSLWDENHRHVMCKNLNWKK